MNTVLAWTLRAVGAVGVVAAGVRLAEWHIERWIIGHTRILP